MSLDLSVKRNADILENHTCVNSKSARSHFSRLIRTARLDKERIVITDYGEPAAAVISISDLRSLEAKPDLDWIDNISDREFEEMDLDTLKKRLKGEKIDAKE